MIASLQTILIVDENRQTGNFARSVFVRAGYAAHVAASAREAIDHLLADPQVAVMVLDLQILASDTPLRSVLESRRPDMKFIFLTDTQNARELEEAATANFWPVFPKAFAPGEMLRVLKLVLDMENVPNTPPSPQLDEPERGETSDSLLGV